MIGNRHHAHEFARRLGWVSLSLLAAAALHGARSGVSGVENHGLAVRVGGAVHATDRRLRLRGASTKVKSPCGAEPVVYVLIWLA